MKFISLAMFLALSASAVLATNGGKRGYGGCGGRCGDGHHDSGDIVAGGDNNEGSVGGIVSFYFYCRLLLLDILLIDLLL